MPTGLELVVMVRLWKPVGASGSKTSSTTRGPTNPSSCGCQQVSSRGRGSALLHVTSSGAASMQDVYRQQQQAATAAAAELVADPCNTTCLAAARQLASCSGICHLYVWYSRFRARQEAVLLPRPTASCCGLQPILPPLTNMSARSPYLCIAKGATHHLL